MWTAAEGRRGRRVENTRGRHHRVWLRNHLPDVLRPTANSHRSAHRARGRPTRRERARRWSRTAARRAMKALGDAVLQWKTGPPTGRTKDGALRLTFKAMGRYRVARQEEMVEVAVAHVPERAGGERHPDHRHRDRRRLSEPVGIFILANSFRDLTVHDVKQTCTRELHRHPDRGRQHLRHRTDDTNGCPIVARHGFEGVVLVPTARPSSTPTRVDNRDPRTAR